MSQSSLVTRQWWANESNYTVGRQDKIRGIVIHHAASTSLESVGTVFSQYGRDASAHYGVCGNQVHQYVREEDTAWHCSNWAGNNATIGIETVNSTGAPEWKVADDTLETLIKLVADIAKRNGLGKLWINPEADFPALSGHKDWYGASTVCPGPYLYPKLQYICDRANAINYPPETSSVSWKDITPETYETAKEANLYNIITGAVVSTYKKGTSVKLVQVAMWNGEEYGRTEWSRDNNLNNGFKMSEMVIPSLAPEPEPEKPQEEDPDESSDNPRGLDIDEYKKLIEGIENNAKEKKVMIQMSNKVYDILKIIAVIVLPLIQVLYTGLAKIWGFGFGEQVDQTVQLLIAAVNAILGIAIVKSSSDYRKNK
jgi:N-acetylmuramoyl-L-alanine amidase CwlA